jgi:hypothetical protein
VRCISSQDTKIIDLNYADLDPVYVPIKKDEIEVQGVEDVQEDQHSMNLVCPILRVNYILNSL